MGKNSHIFLLSSLVFSYNLAYAESEKETLKLDGNVRESKFQRVSMETDNDDDSNYNRKNKNYDESERRYKNDDNDDSDYRKYKEKETVYIKITRENSEDDDSKGEKVWNNGSILVSLEDDIDPEKFAKKHDLSVTRQNKNGTFVFQIEDDSDVIKKCNRLQKLRGVNSAEPNWRRKRDYK
jgi:hypothetical protein